MITPSILALRAISVYWGWGATIFTGALTSPPMWIGPSGSATGGALGIPKTRPSIFGRSILGSGSSMRIGSGSSGDGSGIGIFFALGLGISCCCLGGGGWKRSCWTM